VIKKTGAQLARVVGIAGATVLADGEISLIINPSLLFGRELKLVAAPAEPAGPATVAEERRPVVMVVDDSLTVRKITGRLLEREGFQVVTAKDGVDALEQLTDLVPDVMLVDIEMPRMDGFDLTRNVRGDARLKAVPIIMITSRLADKHRNYAAEIGVNHYLGKPYQEDELLGLIRSYTESRAAVA
jgi:chemosensory pili system protein ChpA (sensor histidine kinase/response regulator)